MISNKNTAYTHNDTNNLQIRLAPLLLLF